MKIKEEISNSTLTEAGHGNREVRFAFINEKGVNITPFVKCKDYFNDMFWSNKVNKPINIFGFVWMPGQDKGELDKPRLSIAIRTETGRKLVPITEEEKSSIISMLINFSDRLGYGDIVGESEEDGGHFIVHFDKRWTEIPYVNSAFFLLIRAAFGFDPGKEPLEYLTSDKSRFVSFNDQSYLKSVKVRQKFEDLYKGNVDKSQKYEDYNNGNIHNGSGVVGYQNYKIV
jgi:hypothetical protein